MNVTYENLNPMRWAELITSLSNQNEELLEGSGKIVFKDGERKIFLNRKYLNDKDVLDKTREVLNENLSLELLNKINSASHALEQRVHIKKQNLQVHLKGWAARISAHANQEGLKNVIAKIVCVVTFGIFYFIWNYGNSFHEKNRMYQDVLIKYKSQFESYPERYLELLIEEQDEFFDSPKVIDRLLAEGKKNLVIPDEETIEKSKINCEYFFNMKLVMDDVPEVTEPVDINLLITWYRQIENLIPSRIYNGFETNTKEEIKEKFEFTIKNLLKPESQECITPEKNLKLKLLKHLTLYLKKKEKEIKKLESSLPSNADANVRKDLDTKKKNFFHEVKGLLVENLGVAFKNCSERVILELKNIYYETIAYDPEKLEMDGLTNILALLHLADRRRLFSIVVQTVTQDKDAHLANTLNKYERAFNKKFGLGSSEFPEQGDEDEDVAMEEVPVFDVTRTVKVYSNDGKLIRIEYEPIYDLLGERQIMMPALEAIEARFRYLYQSEHVVNITMEALNSIRASKKGGLLNYLIYQWFRERYAFKYDDLLDANQKWSKGVIFIFLRDLNILNEAKAG